MHKTTVARFFIFRSWQCQKLHAKPDTAPHIVPSNVTAHSNLFSEVDKTTIPLLKTNHWYCMSPIIDRSNNTSSPRIDYQLIVWPKSEYIKVFLKMDDVCTPSTRDNSDHVQHLLLYAYVFTKYAMGCSAHRKFSTFSEQLSQIYMLQTMTFYLFPRKLSLFIGSVPRCEQRIMIVVYRV